MIKKLLFKIYSRFRIFVANLFGLCNHCLIRPKVQFTKCRKCRNVQKRYRKKSVAKIRRYNRKYRLKGLRFGFKRNGRSFAR